MKMAKGGKSSSGNSSGNSHGNSSGTSKTRKTAGVVGTLGLAAATLSGMVFLPEKVMQWLGDTLFPFLPEEYRSTAVSVCSCTCCCCSCILAVGLVVFMMKK